MNVTRDQALCILFYKEYNEENLKECKQRFKSWGDDFDICYKANLPKEPIIVNKLRIISDPFSYKKYHDSNELCSSEETNKRKKYELKTESQTKVFLNEIFRFEDPGNNEDFKAAALTTQNILEVAQQYCNIFNERNSQSFSRWCSAHNLSFLKGKLIDTKGSKRRNIFVLNEKYYDNLMVGICEYLPKYKNTVLNLKTLGYEIIGYARKSDSEVNSETRKKLLEKMANNLRERSKVDKVFMSVCSKASQPLNERDLSNTTGILETLENINGSTSDMLEYLQSISHNVCLVSLDFAGLASRSFIIKDLLEEYPVIKKIAIDTFAADNEILLLDSELLLSDNNLLEKFDCRKKLVQRSK